MPDEEEVAILVRKLDRLVPERVPAVILDDLALVLVPLRGGVQVALEVRREILRVRRVRDCRDDSVSGLRENVTVRTGAYRHPRRSPAA